MTALAAHTRTLVFLVFLAFLQHAFAKLSAWNGYTPNEPAISGVFAPYYVPPGAKSVASSSPYVHYRGNWHKSFSSKYVGHTKFVTSQPGAAVSFSFVGDRVECYGTRSRLHDALEVLIDGRHIALVDNWSNSAERAGQCIYAADGLGPGRHTIKLIHQPQRNRSSIMDLEAFVVTPPRISTRSHSSKRSIAPREPSPDDWSLIQKGSTGVNAMQLVVVSNTRVLIVDKVEHNPITVDGHPAWASLYNLEDHTVKPVSLMSNSFCAGGSFLGNGTLVNVGGNPIVTDHTGPADFGDVNGLQGIRLFHPCDAAEEDCSMYENPDRIKMASPRWYNTVLRISDGSAMIIGGSIKGGWINNRTVNNPTIEYYPPKSIHGSKGRPIHMPFLEETVGSNLFAIAISLPDGKVFVAANRDAMIYDWEKNTETRLPRLPNGVRITYPLAGTGVLFPLSHKNNYMPTVLLCGGSAIDDQRAAHEIDSQEPASSQCVRMDLTSEGIKRGWEVEHMPQARIMPDAVLLPTGEVLIVNGAGSGISGYGNVKNQVGSSNAANPVFSPVLYDPYAPAGSRFSSKGLPESDIPRLYHSVASLTPRGNVMIAGSNPNLDRSEVAYGTEYRVEWLNPPYMTKRRPDIVGFRTVEKVEFGKTVDIRVDNCPGKAEGLAAFMDLGYITHATHTNTRLVHAVTVRTGEDRFRVTAPPNGNIYPPGPAFLYFLCDGVPSEGRKVLLGDGRSPPVDEDAIKRLLK
ncbi:hypothetical protein V5O48_007268 [Marasmius crinis-equi]|uniref:Copper radical oxidase n=1 Tax=Marasmius crinis-equi TaxID=585013 RepID=A0ABR3FH78_9AGAR